MSSSIGSKRNIPHGGNTPASKLPKIISDDEPPPNDQGRLKWSSEPEEETFSDWKIEIVIKEASEQGKLKNDEIRALEETCDQGGSEVTTYHVHKCILAYGNRRSEYFARLFLGGDNFQESKADTSRIELDPLAASCFPVLLDYMYTPEMPLNVGTQTATALHYLGEYFEMRHLRWDVKQFCKRDMCLKNVETYHDHATLFRNETILSNVAGVLSKNIEHVPLSSPLLQKADPQLWTTAFKGMTLGSNASLHWSKLLLEIGNHHKDTLDKEALGELSTSESFTRVDPTVALDLCILQDTLPGGSDEAEKKSWLQSQCVKALGSTWSQMLDWDEVTLTHLKNRKPDFLVDLLMHSLGESKRELDKQSNCAQNLQRSNAELYRQLSSKNSLLSSRNVDLAELRAQLIKATSVINKLKPVPVHNTGYYSRSGLVNDQKTIPSEISELQRKPAQSTAYSYEGHPVLYCAP